MAPKSPHGFSVRALFAFFETSLDVWDGEETACTVLLANGSAFAPAYGGFAWHNRRGWGRAAGGSRPYTGKGHFFSSHSSMRRSASSPRVMLCPSGAEVVDRAAAAAASPPR